MQNPLFPSNDNQASQIPDYLQTRQVSDAAYATQLPQSPVETEANFQAAPIPERNNAADLIRQKVAAIYDNEPDAARELQEVIGTRSPLSKHQQYMQGLNDSGRSWAEIQNAWHEYYSELPDAEKHEVWQEFYSANQTSTPAQQQIHHRDLLAAAKALPAAGPTQERTIQYNQSGPSVIPADFSPKSPSEQPSSEKPSSPRPTVADIKQRIRDTVSAGGKIQKKQHFQSLAFGLASGAVVVFIFLFGFFNEVFITPFVQPSRKATETPIIVNTASAVVGTTPKVLIPKINVEIPVDYSQTTTDEKAIETALDKGIVHYPTTVRPGQPGNAAFFGHSSNNIFNPGKYKFAFVLLHKLVNGDTFYLSYEGKAYAYEVISSRIVKPTEVGVLGPVPGQAATATLITCDPPGTSINRLVVVGKQISPDPGGNTAPPATAPILAATDPAAGLPGNGPTLWSRMWNSIF